MIKKRYIFLILILIIVLVTGCSKETASNENEVKDIEDMTSVEVVETFIKYLFNNDDNVLNYVTGKVKKNIYNNFDNVNKTEVINIDNTLELDNDNISIIHSTIEYETDNGINVICYRFKLANIENRYLIYKVEEAPPIFKENKEENEDDKEIYKVIDGYYKAIEEKDFEKAADYLVGRAKSNYLLTFDYLKELYENIEKLIFTDIEYNKIFDDGKFVLVKNSYSINDKDLQVLITLYKTHQGWMIYDVEEI